MKRFILAALALSATSPALAATHPIHIIWNPQCQTGGGQCGGKSSLPGYTTATMVQGFTTPDVLNNTPYVAQTVPGVFSETVHNGSSGNPHNPPPLVSMYETAKSGMTGQYLGLANGTDYTINFLQGGVQFFSFAFNNLGKNDKVTLTFGDGGTYTYTGSDILNLNGGSIIGLANNSIPGQPNDWGRVSYDFLGYSPLVSAAFHSGSDTLYLDSFAWAAPEPGTWALMILGFGFAGWQLRSRRRKVAAVAA